MTIPPQLPPSRDLKDARLRVQRNLKSLPALPQPPRWRRALRNVQGGVSSRVAKNRFRVARVARVTRRHQRWVRGALQHHRNFYTLAALIYFAGWWLEWGGYGAMAAWTLGWAGAGILVERRLTARGTPEHRAVYSPAYLP